MSEKDIFEKLFSLIPLSNDKNGAVAACLLHEGKIMYESVSDNESVHAEYALLKKMEEAGRRMLPKDIVYTTVEPCGKRTPGGRGEKMGDCTSNLIKAGVKKVVYAAADPHASEETRHKFLTSNSQLLQVEDKEIIRKAVEMFNATCEDPSNWLPLV
jgi:pyrimidine deaminase RibD-like protein